MERITRWSPDTCDCVIDIGWDDSVPDTERRHTYNKSVKVCPYHVAEFGKPSHLQVVLGENQLKNYVMVDAAEILGIKMDITHDSPESERLAFDRFINSYQWSFDDNRKLTINFSGTLDAQQKTQLQQVADTKYGIGKIEVNSIIAGEGKKV